MADKT